MTNVLVRDVPTEVHDALSRRAKEQGVSLQQYLMTELERLAARPTQREVLARISRRTGGRVGYAEAVDDLRDARR